MASVAEMESPSAPLESALMRVYNGVRIGVITGEFAQGSRLNEKRFAEMFRVSRVPLREAFGVLERDGFLVSEPRRSAVVSSWTAERAGELFDARLALEVESARYAVRRVAAGASLDDLERTLAESEHDAIIGDDLARAESSTRFHLEVVALTGNRLMSNLMHTISQEMTWLFYLTSQRDAQQACDEHHELFDAIASGNEGLAQAVAYTHIERGREPSLASLRGIAG